MFVEQMIIRTFRHLADVKLGPFRQPPTISELTVLAGPNGGGKSSVLELLSFGLTSRYSWAFYQARHITDHSFAIKIGLTNQEIDTVLAAAGEEQSLISFLRANRGYWAQVNLKHLSPEEARINERVHGLVSREYVNFTRKLGFFIRSDRSYGPRQYNQRQLFKWKRRLSPEHFNSISYAETNVQYEDMYDFLVEQSYHYVYQRGAHAIRRAAGEATKQPPDPLQPYNELLGRLFPGYGFEQTEEQELTLRIKLPTGKTIPFQDMSSGEKEVFFILGFFLRHDVEHSVIVIDEPELHLHPELARKLVRELRSIKPGNQVWCATHSAELIDEAGRERTYYFAKTTDGLGVSCKRASEEANEVELLRNLFGYSGYIGIAQKVVFSEGNEASADRKTFVNVLPEYTKAVKIIPVGSKDNLYRINRAILALLESDFARCEFFLIRDRDYLGEATIATHRARSGDRLFVLRRHQIENYLVSESAISAVLRDIYQKSMPPEVVRQQLMAIAKRNSAGFLRDLTVSRYGELYQMEDCSIGQHSSGQSILTGSGDLNPSVLDPLREALNRRLGEVNRSIEDRVGGDSQEVVFGECLEEVRVALRDDSDAWKELFPGRYLLERFSAANGLGEWPALQNLIIERISGDEGIVDPELAEIFRTIGGTGAPLPASSPAASAARVNSDS